MRRRVVALLVVPFLVTGLALAAWRLGLDRGRVAAWYQR